MLVLLFVALWFIYSTRRFFLSLALCYFVVVFYSPFSSAITSLGQERASLGAFRTFARFALVWFCLPLGVWEGLRFVIVALPGRFPYNNTSTSNVKNCKPCYHLNKQPVGTRGIMRTCTISCGTSLQPDNLRVE